MTTTTAASTYSLNDAQKVVAQKIIKAGHDLGATNEEIVGAISVAISESNLREGTGVVGDHGEAVGTFQQHSSYGTAEKRGNAYEAAKAFLSQLIPKRQNPTTIAVKLADIQRPAGWHPGGPSNWTGPNPRLYGNNLDEALTVFNQVSASPYTGSVGDIKYPDPVLTGPSGPAGPVGPNGVDPITGDPVSTDPYEVSQGVLKGLDSQLNAKGGLLNPIGQGRMLIARGAVIVAGTTMSIFGLILIVGAIGKSKTVSDVTNVVSAVPGGGTVAAAAEVAAL